MKCWTSLSQAHMDLLVVAMQGKTQNTIIKNVTSTDPAELALTVMWWEGWRVGPTSSGGKSESKIQDRDSTEHITLLQAS